MRRFILLVFIGAFLLKNVTSSIQAHPTHLEWLFGSNDKLNEISKETTENVCKSNECEKIAKVISESMDTSADPCDDFYEYACGKWPEHNPIPEGKRSWSLFHMLQQKVEQQVNDILKEKSKSSDILSLKLAKKWYAVCTNTDAMDKQGLDKLVTTLSRTGGWPLIMDPDEWNEEEYSWQKVDDQYMRLIGRNAFHDVRVYSYSANKTVQIGTPHLPPGTMKLWLEQWYDSDEIEDEDDNEDPSDEEEQSRENSEDNEEPDGSGDDEDDNDDEDDEDDEDDDNSEDNDIDNDDRDDEQSKDRKKKISKKKISKKKSTNDKLTQKKNKKMHHNKKTKSNTRIVNSHKMKKQRVKRRAVPSKIHSKHVQHLTHHLKKLRKSKRNHVKEAHDGKRTKKTLKTLSATTTPEISIEETSDEADGDEKAQQVYANYILEVARAIAEAGGSEISEELIDKDIKDLIEFQVKLLEIKGSSEYEELELTLDDFQQWYNERKPDTANRNAQINWVYKIKELFEEAHVSVDGDLNLNIRQPEYFEPLADLLNETPSRTIVNYIQWNFLSVMIETTTSEMRKLYDAWDEWDIWDKSEDDEESEKEERSHICKGQIQLHDILAYEYVKRHFSDDITKIATDIFDDIQKEVEYQIKESEWLDEDTKDHVFEKLVNMKKYIGYPDWYRNNTIVKRYFQGLILTNSYYENRLSYNRYRKWKQLRELKKNNDRDDDDVWWMSPLTVNAFFSPGANSISLSAADFQSPFFAHDRPQAINYGIVGVIMGHEVNHGFDDDGFFYDKNGNIINEDDDEDNAEFVEWLSIMSREYGKRANCFVEQFNNYPLEKDSTRKIPNYGNQTSGENIADTMGLQASYRAYQRRERECGKPDVVLPGLKEVTTDQLFFLSFANVWCQAVNNSTTRVAIASRDVHSIGRLRVIGSVSNSEDFAKAFNCPVGSKMNPEKKCNIWK